MKFPTTFAKGGRSLWTAKIISQSRQNARRDSIFSVKNEVLSSISSTRVTQTEPSPGRAAARRPPWQTNCGAAHRPVRAIRAGNPATRQGAARPSTRPTESIPADAIGFAAGERNGRPRRKLGYRTPEELFERFLDSVYAAPDALMNEFLLRRCPT